jgi:hypothetical protein
MVVEVDLEEEKILDNITTQYTQNQLCKFFEEENGFKIQLLRPYTFRDTTCKI